MANPRSFIPNQVFVGLPWKNVRPRYERIIKKLESKYPLHFSIIGRNDGQEADDLLAVITQRIGASSYAVFDATGGNANVSLEYGYAEGVDVPRSIFLSTHKAAQRTPGSPIISDLSGKRRIQYKTEQGLSLELHTLAREHPYTVRFEKALSKVLKGVKKGQKKRRRTMAIKILRELDGRAEVRRAELVQQLQAAGYAQAEVEDGIKKLHSSGVINCTVGRDSKVRVI